MGGSSPLALSGLLRGSGSRVAGPVSVRVSVFVCGTWIANRGTRIANRVALTLARNAHAIRTRSRSRAQRTGLRLTPMGIGRVRDRFHAVASSQNQKSCQDDCARGNGSEQRGRADPRPKAMVALSAMTFIPCMAGLRQVLHYICRWPDSVCRLSRFHGRIVARRFWT